MSENGSNAVRLCRLEELVVGAARGFDPEQTGEDTMFVLRRADGVRAYLNRCPHQGTRLEYRKNRFLSADGTRVICHGHGAHFDPDTGVCIHGACPGQALEPVPCRIEYGWVWIWLRGSQGER
jgi:nitrite reductase/ring-hydroxylating ferredoxin subunit